MCYHINHYVEHSPSHEESHHPAVTEFLTQEKSEKENAENWDRV